jgi:hypothetical protein
MLFEKRACSKNWLLLACHDAAPGGDIRLQGDSGFACEEIPYCLTAAR